MGIVEHLPANRTQMREAIGMLESTSHLMTQ